MRDFFKSTKLSFYCLGLVLLSFGLPATLLGNEDTNRESSIVSENASFTLNNEAYVTTEYVRLKHLTNNRFLNQKDAEILICKRPQSAKPITLTKEYLVGLLKTSGISDKTFFLMEIPSEIKIIASVSVNENVEDTKTATNKKPELSKNNGLTEIDSAEILMQVSNHIEQQLYKYNPQVSLYQQNSTNTWKVKVPEDYDLKILPGIMIRANSVSAKVAVYYKNTLVDARMFNFKADIFIKTLAAELALEKGHIIKKGDFTMQAVPYSQDALNAIRDEKTLIGNEIQKSVKVGEALEASDINTPQLINRGSSVTVMVKDEGYTIRTTGIAQEAGRLGDQIQVMMKNSDLKIKCTVSGENIVNINK